MPSALAGPGVSRPMARTASRGCPVTARMSSNVAPRACTAMSGPSDPARTLDQLGPGTPRRGRAPWRCWSCRRYRGPRPPTDPRSRPHPGTRGGPAAAAGRDHRRTASAARTGRRSTPCARRWSRHGTSAGTSANRAGSPRPHGTPTGAGESRQQPPAGPHRRRRAASTAVDVAVEVAAGGGGAGERAGPQGEADALAGPRLEQAGGVAGDQDPAACAAASPRSGTGSGARSRARARCRRGRAG